MNHAICIISALPVNAALGGQWLRRAWRHGVVYQGMEALLRETARKLNRPQRGRQALKRRGFLLAVLAMLAAGAAGLVLGWVALLDWLLAAWLLPVRASWDGGWKLYAGLRDGNRLAAEEALEDSVPTWCPPPDGAGLARGGIEMLAVSFAEKILAPALAYLCFGLAGLLASRTVYYLKERLYRPETPDEPFAAGVALAHAAAHYIPARLALLLWLAVVPFLPGTSFATAARQVRQEGVNAGTPERVALLAAASALGLTLGGPSSFYVREWVGVGTAKARLEDVKRALYAFVLLHLLLIALLGLFL